MKLTNKISIAVIVLISSLLIVLSYFDLINDTLVTFITIITAIIGAFGIWLELNKEQEVNQASFILEFHKTFYENELAPQLEKLLDADFSNKKKLVLTGKDEDMIIQYLTWIKTLSTLVLRGMVKINSIDDLFAYKFFVAVNNPYIQKLELVPYASTYKGIYRLHKVWKKWREKQGSEIYKEETDLSFVKGYEDNAVLSKHHKIKH